MWWSLRKRACGGQARLLLMKGVPEPADGVENEGVAAGVGAVDFNGAPQDAADGGVGTEGKDASDSVAELLAFVRGDPFGYGGGGRLDG